MQNKVNYSNLSDSEVQKNIRRIVHQDGGWFNELGQAESNYFKVLNIRQQENGLYEMTIIIK